MWIRMSSSQTGSWSADGDAVRYIYGQDNDQNGVYLQPVTPRRDSITSRDRLRELGETLYYSQNNFSRLQTQSSGYSNLATLNTSDLSQAFGGQDHMLRYLPSWLHPWSEYSSFNRITTPWGQGQSSTGEEMRVPSRIKKPRRFRFVSCQGRKLLVTVLTILAVLVIFAIGSYLVYDLVHYLHEPEKIHGILRLCGVNYGQEYDDMSSIQAANVSVVLCEWLMDDVTSAFNSEVEFKACNITGFRAGSLLALFTLDIIVLTKNSGQLMDVMTTTKRQLLEMILVMRVNEKVSQFDICAGYIEAYEVTITAREVTTTSTTDSEVTTNTTTDREVATVTTTDREVATTITTDREVATATTTDREVATAITTDREVATAITTDNEVQTTTTTTTDSEVTTTTTITKTDRKITTTPTESKVKTTTTTKNEAATTTTKSEATTTATTTRENKVTSPTKTAITTLESAKRSTTTPYLNTTIKVRGSCNPNPCPDGVSCIDLRGDFFCECQVCKCTANLVDKRCGPIKSNITGSCQALGPGFYPVLSDCSKYLWCFPSGHVIQQCAKGSVFLHKEQRCGLPDECSVNVIRKPPGK